MSRKKIQKRIKKNPNYLCCKNGKKYPEKNLKRYPKKISGYFFGFFLDGRSYYLKILTKLTCKKCSFPSWDQILSYEDKNVLVPKKEFQEF